MPRFFSPCTKPDKSEACKSNNGLFAKKVAQKVVYVSRLLRTASSIAQCVSSAAFCFFQRSTVLSYFCTPQTHRIHFCSTLANLPSPDHQPHATASCLQPCYSGYCLLSATPSSATPSYTRHATPFHRLWHHKITT